MHFKLYRRPDAERRGREPGGEAVGDEPNGRPGPTEGQLHRDPSLAAAGAPGAPVPPVVVPRWVQLVVLPLAILGLWALARASGSILLILIGAATIALILNPLVRVLESWRVPRGLAILLIYLGGFAALGGIGVLLSDPIGTQVNNFANDVPHYVDKANHDLANFQSWLNRHGIRVQIEHQGQTALQTLQRNVLRSSGSIVSFSRDAVGRVVTLSFDLVLTFVLSIYLLVYGRQIGELVKRIMPDGDGTPADDFPLLVQRAVFGYVRGQLLFSLIMGVSAALCLWVFGLLGIFPAGRQYAVFFGAFYGLMEFIPYIGPIIGPAPAVVVALFNDPISALWVTLLFVALQQLEGHIVAPQVFRISLRINPIVVILSLLIGYQIYGIAGALLALPVAATLRQTVLYLRRHLVLEPWRTTPVGELALPVGGSSDPCPDCGTETRPGDAYCRSCGASLETSVRTPG